VDKQECGYVQIDQCTKTPVQECHTVEQEGPEECKMETITR
jgi:hypothetical protein